MQTASIVVPRRLYPPPPPTKPGGPRLIGVTLHMARDQEIFGEGEPASQVYKVVSGAVRGFRVLSDGRRQICDFYLPGDVFGVEPDGEHRVTAEALTDTFLVAARRSSLGEDSATMSALWRLAIGELRRSHDHALTLGRRSASERVVNFLMEMADRLGGAADHLVLPMSRQDIADYLGLTIETVSRALSHLQMSGMISLSGCRSIRLCKPGALAQLCA